MIRITFISTIAILISNLSFGQNLEVGFRYTQIANNNGSTLLSTDNTEKVIGNVFIGGPIITLKTDSQLFFRLRLDYFSAGIHENRGINNPTGRYSIMESELLTTGLEFGFAVGKYFKYKSLTIKYGIDFPFFLNLKNNIRHSETSSYLDDQLTNKIVVDSEQPRGYYAGITMIAGVEYYFLKYFSVGFELSNGIFYYWLEGTSIRESNSFDANGNLLTSETREDEISEKGFESLMLKPSVKMIFRF